MSDNVLTTNWGAPVGDNQNSLTVGPFGGPVLLQDVALVEKLAIFGRERIPERVVHAKGAGAHGYFEVTHDMSKYCKAKFMNRVGKRTPVFTRFSTVAGERGSADTERDPRGFAVKFYTEEGNYDMVGNNTPVFFIRDSIKFPDFIHTQKRNPQTNCKDPNAIWDFWGLVPESTHQVSLLFTDRGIPDGYRKMNGYSSHAWKWVNEEGKQFWVKLHFKTETGIKNLTTEEADQYKVTDPDYATRDLFEHIEKGGEAGWRVCAQIMPYEDAWTYRFNPFDVTKIWPHKDYPLVQFGRMVLNRNPSNYHAEVEQSAFSPATLVPGIEPSPDKMLQGRLFSYPDTQRYRLGGNYLQLKINCPYRARLNNYQRDGVLSNGQGGSSLNYEPNSFGGPTAKPDAKIAPFELKGVVGQYNHNHPNDDFVQPGNLYRHVLGPAERTRLVNNLSGAMKPVKREDVKIRAIRNFYRADPEFGIRIAQNLGLDVSKVRLGNL